MSVAELSESSAGMATLEEVARRDPSGDQAKLNTGPSWLSSTADCLPVVASQIRTLLSTESSRGEPATGTELLWVKAAARRDPSADQAIPSTESACASRMVDCSPVAASQTRTL